MQVTLRRVCPYGILIGTVEAEAACHHATVPHATHSHTHGSLIANAAQLSPANCCSRQVSTTCLPQSPLRETERQSERVFGALLPHGCNWQVATAIKTAAQPELTINPDCLAAPFPRSPATVCLCHSPMTCCESMKLPQNAEHAACKAARSLRHRTENAVVFTDRTLFTGGVTYKHTQTQTHTYKDRQTRVVFEIPASI